VVVDPHGPLVLKVKVGYAEGVNLSPITALDYGYYPRRAAGHGDELPEGAIEGSACPSRASTIPSAAPLLVVLRLGHFG
jgi:hypothetical protein